MRLWHLFIKKIGCKYLFEAILYFYLLNKKNNGMIKVHFLIYRSKYLESCFITSPIFFTKTFVTFGILIRIKLEIYIFQRFSNSVVLTIETIICKPKFKSTFEGTSKALLFNLGKQNLTSKTYNSPRDDIQMYLFILLI